MIRKYLLAMTLAGSCWLAGCSSLERKTTFQRESIRFIAVKDTPALTADIYRPDLAGKVPGVLVVHGGSWSQRSGDMESICENLARQGFLAFNTTYRLAPESLYPKAVRDVEGALNYMRENAEKWNLDPDRISIWGYSAGGHLALMVGLNESMKVQAIVAGGAPTDFTKFPDSPIIQGFLGQSYQKAPQLWAEASPVNHVGEKSPPVFLYHGEWDNLVKIDHMGWMRDRLKQKGRAVETLALSWQGHITTYLFSQQGVDEAIRFLQKIESQPTVYAK